MKFAKECTYEYIYETGMFHNYTRYRSTSTNLAVPVLASFKLPWTIPISIDYFVLCLELILEAVIWNCPDNWFGDCLLIGIVQTIDFGDCPLIGIVQTRDFGDHPVIGIV